MNLVRQRGDSDCGVAAFAMLTDRSYEEARETLGCDVDVPDHTLRVLLQRDGWFIRDIHHRSETGGVWPPPPFAERHFAIVTQPSGNGHYVVMEGDGTVLDPLVDAPRRLDDWTVCSNVLGIVRGRPRPIDPEILDWWFRAKADGSKFVVPPIAEDLPTPLAEGGVEPYCGCSCHVPIGSGLRADRQSCIHCELIA